MGSDYDGPISIKLGGVIPVRLIAAMATCLVYDNCKYQTQIKPTAALSEDLLACYKLGRCFELDNENQRDGELLHTEQFMVRFGISFVRYFNGSRMLDGEIVWWRPGMREPASVLLDANRGIMVPLLDISSLVNDSLVDRKPESLVTVVKNLTKYTGSKLPCFIPPVKLIT